MAAGGHSRSSRSEAGNSSSTSAAPQSNSTSLAAAAAAVSAAAHAPSAAAAPPAQMNQSCKDDKTCPSVCDMEGMAPREVPLQALHIRSAPLSLASRSLSQGLDSARRLDALEWLVQAFDALNLPDTQLFAAFGLLDRFAAASPAPISAGPGAFALVLAAMLVALKVSGTQRDLDRAKRLVVEVSGSSRPWAAVRRAELSILRRLSFRACTPTSRELLDRVLSDAAEKLAVQETGAWDAEVREKTALLSRFLLELGLVHEPDAVYGPGRPPLAAALAAILLAMLAMNAPKICYEAIEESLVVLESGDALVTELAEAMRHRWATEERRTLGGQNSPVMEKWMRRDEKWKLGATPPHASDLRFILTGAAGEGSVSGLGSGASRAAAAAAMDIAPVLSAPVTDSSLRRVDGHATYQATQQPTPRAALAPTHAPPAVVAPQQQLVGAGATACKFPSAQLASQLSRAAATENLSSWPLAGTAPGAGVGCLSGDRTDDSSLPPVKAARETSKAQPGAQAPEQRSPEVPLVELTHVLNMVVPRVQAPGGGRQDQGIAGATKSRPPSVAAELLVSSALRMQWPVDRRKVACGDAAVSCREAAAVLQEAASQLNNAAMALDNGVCPAREMKMQGSESKRRRTFGGPSPARAPSPGGGPLAPRGSPPQVRLAGLRV